MKGQSAMDEHDTLLSQAYGDAARGEPGPALDARILGAARQAVVKPVTPRHGGWWRWLVPASSAIVLVLALGVVLRIQQEAPERVGLQPELKWSVPSEDVVPAPRLETAQPQAPASAQAPAPKAGAARQADDRAGAVPAPSRSAPVQAEGNVAPSLAAPAVEPSPAPAPAADSAPRGGTGASSAFKDREAVPPTASQPFPGAVMSAPRPARSEAKSMAPPSVPRADRELSSQSLGAAASSAEESVPHEMRKARAKAAPATGPEADLEAIRQALRAGRGDEARRLLAEFSVRYPDYTLPDDLRVLR
jgi:hypothetical protein